MQKVFGLCAAKTGTKIDESMHSKRMDTKGCGKMLNTNRNTRRGEGPCQECERVDKIEGRKKKGQQEGR